MSTRLVDAQNIRKIYLKGSNQVDVLRGVNFQLFAGETVAITGASGVGKSSLLHILGGLDVPTSGNVFFQGAQSSIFSYSDEELAKFRNREIGFVFQFHHLLGEFSALENVMMPALIGGFSRPIASKMASTLLDAVGLSNRLHHLPSEMSGGEQQRTAVARSLVMRPKLLLADELTGNLDSKNAESVVSLLLELNQKLGVALVLVTHDPVIASRMHRIIVMRDGVIES